jgi:hypothetical protein
MAATSSRRRISPLCGYNNGTGHVYHARTSGFSSRPVAPNATTTANFKVPATIELGASSLVAVANGVPSARVAVTISTNTNASLKVTPSTNIAGSGTQYGPFEPTFFQYQLSASAGSLSYATSAPRAGSTYRRRQER